MEPKSHCDPVFPDLVQDIRSGSLSGSEALAVRLTWLPAEANTSGPIVRVGKAFSTMGLERRGFARVFGKFKRPPVEVLWALGSLNASKLPGSRTMSRASYAVSAGFWCARAAITPETCGVAIEVPESSL